jgi:NAD(P)-dependent dehydrogenase (short-subunit alcohol dehydrogenase family)
VHGRDPDKVAALVGELRASGTSEGFVADLANLKDVERLAAEVAGRSDLTVLVNNAGVGFGERGGGREVSADGYELRWAVNLLAPVRLTRALLPTLKANAPSRVVNVGSGGQVSIDFDDLQMEQHYDGVDAYRRSKLALAAWTFELADELAGTGVTTNVLHPATFMDTQMVRDYGQEPHSTVEQGGEATLRLILDETGTTGQYFNGTRKAQAHPDAYDPAVRAKLREVLI